MDEAAYDELYATSYRRLVAQIYTMCGNLAEAQDCVQEAFVGPGTSAARWIPTSIPRLGAHRRLPARGEPVASGRRGLRAAGPGVRRLDLR